MHLALGVLVAVIIVAPQLIGGVFGWSVLVIAIASAVAALLAARIAPTQTAASFLVIACVAGVLYTTLQAVPLPRFLMSWLMPLAVESPDGARAALGL